MPKLVGYARISPHDQDVQLQLNALETAGCAKNKIFTDTISGVKKERPGLDKYRSYALTAPENCEFK